MPKIVCLGHEGLQGDKCRCHGQRQLDFLNDNDNCNLKNPIVAVHDRDI